MSLRMSLRTHARMHERLRLHAGARASASVSAGARTGLRALLAALLALALAACGDAATNATPAQPAADAPNAADAATRAPAPVPDRTVLVMGDSLSAGYGLQLEEGWVALTADRIAEAHPRWRVVNASISGETTAGGAARIGAALERHTPDIVVIELGGNDGLRGLSLQQTRDNLEAMIRAAQAADARVLLVGMRIPPNYGPDYTAGFEANFRELAEQYGTAFLPFLLEPIAMDDTAFQSDRIHPTAEAQPALRDHLWPVLEPLLQAP